MRGFISIRFLLILTIISPVLLAQDPFTIIDPYPGDKYTSNGASWGDWNNDGYQDVFVGNGAQSYKFEDFLYKNNGDGTFTKITGQAIVTEVHLTGGGTWGDYDNDGDIDLYITLTEDTPLGTDYKNILYINDGSGNFPKSTTAGAPINDGEYSNTAGWGDYDNDGDLDLFAKNGWQGLKQAQSLYSNDGDGTFTDINAGDMTGDAGKAFISGFAWCDYDMDGDLDVFTCDGGAANNHLWRNDGGGTFTDTGSFPAHFSNGVSWGDYDNDGDFDLFISNYGDGYGDSGNPENNELWVNNGDGTFTQDTSNLIASEASWGMGSAWGDIDNDGDLDLFVANDYEYDTNPNFLYINNGDGTFTKNTTTVGATDPSSQAPHGVAFADYNNDGFLDLFAAVHGPNFMLVNNEPNNGNTNNWIILELEGTSSNRSAIGAKVWATATINGSSVTQLREVSSQTGMASQNSMRVHFGFGSSAGLAKAAATTISEIKVEFPSGKIVTKTNVASNQILTISESEAPISVKLTSFDARMTEKGSVLVQWQTASEMNTAGFYVQKSMSESSGFKRINSSMIDSKGTPSTGAVYTFEDDDIAEFGQYYYRLEEVTLDGASDVMPSVRISVTSDVRNAQQPGEFSLAQNYPNPFNPTTSIDYVLPRESYVQLDIYDLRGAVIRTLVNQNQSGGAYSVQWNGTNQTGESVGSGVYIYRLTTGEFSMTRKMLIAK